MNTHRLRARQTNKNYRISEYPNTPIRQKLGMEEKGDIVEFLG